jgi:hypothetical protein
VITTWPVAAVTLFLVLGEVMVSFKHIMLFVTQYCQDIEGLSIYSCLPNLILFVSAFPEILSMLLIFLIL